MWKKGQHIKRPKLKLNIPCLNTNKRQRKYQHDLDTKLLNLTQAAPNTAWCATDNLKGVQTIIGQAGEASVGLCKTARTPRTMIMSYIYYPKSKRI